MLVANQPLIALGKLRVSSVSRFPYILKNTGNKLKVDRISVGCGPCTQASCDKVEVDAGEQTTLNVVFTPNSTGLQTKSVTVYYTENGHSYNTVVKFSAEVHG